MNGQAFEKVRNDPEAMAYITAADEIVEAIGYTEHSFAHVGRVASVAGKILETLGYSAHEVELAQIAAWLHDIGNLVNRKDHAQSGALMAQQILVRLGFDYSDVAAVVTAVGHHDESVAEPVTPIAAALIIADKADVRRTRVRREEDGSVDENTFDMHDRVNYSAVRTQVTVDRDKKELWLNIGIDTRYSSVMEFFEAFLSRMQLCRRACEKLGLTFRMNINDTAIL
ncbi:MAG: HD domain-containing protein [Clostridia bacterium]|nr:HD domain-containing protein [Clostridia bacterium]